MKAFAGFGRTTQPALCLKGLGRILTGDIDIVDYLEAAATPLPQAPCCNFAKSSACNVCPIGRPLIRLYLYRMMPTQTD